MQPYVYKCLFRNELKQILGHVYIQAAGNYSFEGIRGAAFDVFADYVRQNIRFFAADQPEEILFSIASIDVVAAVPVYG